MKPGNTTILRTAPVAVGSVRRNTRSKILCPAIVVALALAGQPFHAKAQIESNLYSFGSQTNDGTNPRANLIQATDGNFYGTTYTGGTNNRGCIYRITPGGSETNFYSFGSQTNDGANSSAPLVQGSDGYLYGTTVNGGTNNLGTVFRISLTGGYSNLYSFLGPTNDGANPTAGLTKGTNGIFYGTTQKGGTTNNFGTVFKFNTNGTETMLYAFTGPTNDGNQPLTGLVLGSDGNYYGTATFGGITNYDSLGFGTVFRISPGGSYTNLYLFGSVIPDGVYPTSLTQGNDGNFYGTTSSGGAFTNRGSVFRITPGGNESMLYSFGTQANDGNTVSSGLILAGDGNFYGTTEKGGTNNFGTAFRFSPGGAETTLYSFGSPTNDGQSPLAGVILGNDGNFYGTTTLGGSSNKGTVFKLTGTFNIPTNKITSIQINSGTNIVLTINSVSNDTYQLQFTPSLNPVAWSNVTGASFISSKGGLVSLTNSMRILGPEGFFRFSITP